LNLKTNKLYFQKQYNNKQPNFSFPFIIQSSHKIQETEQTSRKLGHVQGDKKRGSQLPVLSVAPSFSLTKAWALG